MLPSFVDVVDGFDVPSIVDVEVVFDTLVGLGTASVIDDCLSYECDLG